VLNVTALKISAVVPGRFDAQQSQLRGEVLGRQIAPARAHSPAFQQIAGQVFHMSANPLARNLVGLRRRRCRQKKRQKRALQFHWEPLDFRSAAHRLRCAAAMRIRVAALNLRLRGWLASAAHFGGRPRFAPRLRANWSIAAMARSSWALYCRRSAITLGIFMASAKKMICDWRHTGKWHIKLTGV
jgi:hypothetical protein